MLQKMNQSSSAKLNWISKHVPISISVASNITGFESTRYFINSKPAVLQNMIEYLRMIGISAHKQMTTKYFDVLYELDELNQKYKEEREEVDSKDIESDFCEEKVETEDSYSESDIIFTPNRKVLSHFISNIQQRGRGGRVVALLPPTSEAGVRSPSRPYVGKLVVACRWSAVYSTEP